MPSISVVLPVFNKAMYLDNVLQDMKQQSYCDFECVIVDDGSTDGSSEICDKFAQEDPRFRVCHISNGGVSHARNLGLDKITGEYITFIDGDDRIHPDYLKSLYMCMLNSQVDMVIGSIERVWENTEKRVLIRAPYEGTVNIEDILHNFARVQLDTGIFGFCVAKLIKRSLIEDLKFDETLVLAEDFDFYLRVYEKTKKIFFLSKPYYSYLQFAENSSGRVDDDKIDYISQLKIMLRYRNFLIKNDCFIDENLKIINQRLRAYTYFSLLHCKRNEIRKKFNVLHEIWKKEKYPLKGVGLLERMILQSFIFDSPVLTMIILYTYDFLRKVRRELR